MPLLSSERLPPSNLKNADWISSPDATQSKEKKMGEVFGRAKRLGLNVECLVRLSELQDLLDDALNERATKEQRGQNTAVEDILVAKLEGEIESEAEKLK
jgi:hypothetical protein